MKLSEINFSKLILEKDLRNNGDQSRQLFLDPNNNLYYKLWDLNFFYRKHFENAYKKGFYKNISTLVDVIEDNNNNILGYITSKGNVINYDNLNKDKYDNLIERVANISNVLNLVYIDFTISNVISYNDKYYLIDLEATVDSGFLSKIPKIQFIIENNNYFYRKKIHNLLKSVDDNMIKIIRNNTYYNKPINYGTANGRVFLEKELLPKLSGKVLYVGVNYYNDFYHKLVKDPNLYETLDVLERSIEFGSPHKHYICNILNFKNQGYLYDHVIFFGILGHPDDWDILKNKEEILKCINVLDSCVAPGGTLLLGPATITLNKNFWDEIYKNLSNKYKQLLLKKIDINYIWHGIKK